MKPNLTTSGRWQMFALVICAFSWSFAAQAANWPQEIQFSEGSIFIYQPQPEDLEGNILTGRAAMSIEMKSSKEPIFGAFRFSSKIETDSDTSTATVFDLKVTEVAWADSTDAGEQKFTSLVEGALPEAGLEISMDQLSASLLTAEREKESLEGLKNDPPVIIFREELAALLLYDGEPRFSPVENSDYERALNAPFAVARNTKTKKVYLSGGTFWYESNDPMGPWKLTTSPPADLVKMVPEPDSDQETPASAPKIVTANEPTELISTQGKPNWESLTGGNLLYVSNTETPWLRELETSNMYVLLSGRWFRSKSQDGPWTFVRSDELPASFSDIPPASDIGGLRVSVAGTEEAQQAMLDAEIPQTTAIKRSEAKLTVEYDGEPKFEKIPDTKVSHAVNTATQVLEIENQYYAVDNGVWFTSASAKGPWVVADEIPDEEIQQIPPSSPVYNTTYVRVYQSTPEIVYVGYTPGYMWSFPYYGVPVYGTGWYYPPYWGRYYYPRPPTWGLHVGYNPWTGWNVGLSWTNGFFSVGVGWGGGWGVGYRPWGCCGGFYGGGYRHNDININTGDINIGNNVNIGNRDKAKNRLDNNGNRNKDRAGNLYNRDGNRARNASPATARNQLQTARATTSRPNNVYADRAGNVARHTDNGWEKRDNGSWKADNSKASNLGSSSRDISRPSTSNNRTKTNHSFSNYDRGSLNHGSLNQSRSARQSGASRQRSRPSSMPRGGGRRR
jgi:hypothetical protein